MTDPNLEEESLISQDDIDKLLDASSIEEAEEKLDAGTTLGDDEFGELSQDDIDSLLNGNSLNGDDAGDDAGGELSQDEIDGLMGGGAEPEEGAAPDEAPGGTLDEGGELSQDDIDSLMSGGEDEEGELSQDDIDSLLGGSDEPEGDVDEDDMELISQDDIDRLMNPAAEDDDPADDELISMEDIQGLMDEDQGGEIDPGETDPDDASELAGDDLPVDLDGEAPAQAVEEDPMDIPIETDQAQDVADCLMTQETMDELIRNAETADPVQAAAPPETQDPDALEAEGPAAEDLGDDLTDGLSDDLDQMLDSDDADIVNLDLDGDGDVTQEDIDALLQETDQDDDFLDDDDILISQDDIDTLLMAADQEDEDVLGDTLLDDVDDSILDELDSDEFMEKEPQEEPEAEEAGDQVLLEEGQEEAPSPKRPGIIPKIFKSKLVLAAASVVLVLGITVPAAYFLFFSDKPAPLPERQAVAPAFQDTGREIEVASITVGQDPDLVSTRQSGSMVLADFIILTPERSRKMAYLYADISIDYSDQRAYHEINNNLSFYRDLIYDAIQTSLVSEKGNEVTQADLIWGIETSLKKVLPPHYIEKISFKTFRTS